VSVSEGIEYRRKTETQHSLERSTKIPTLRNANEMVTTRDTGEVSFSSLPGQGSGTVSGQTHMTTEDGSESVTADFIEFVRFESSIAIDFAYFSTKSTDGILAPLNNTIGVFLDEEQPDGDALVRFLDGEAGMAEYLSAVATTALLQTKRKCFRP
jgi:hypothetical protein